MTLIRRQHTKHPHHRHLGMLIAICLIIVAKSVTAVERDTLIMGIHPYLSYTELQARFRPLAHYLARNLGQPIVVKIGSDYAEHIEYIGRDDIDIAYLGPVLYTQVVERYGSKPLLARLERNGKAMLDGHIIVAQHSPIKQMADLQGKTFGFGDPHSTMSSVVPLAVLKQSGVLFDDQTRMRRYRGHSNIAFAVLSGKVEAGAVKSEVYERFANRGLRSLQRLPEISEHLFIARGDMKEALSDRIRALLLSLHKTPEGRSLLRAIHPDATGLGPVVDSDYDPLRALLRD